MMRSLYSGVAGLKTHQTRMDVIGNNIANVNTAAYKSQSVQFSEMLYQTTSTASGPDASTGKGGVNPRQIGLGVRTGAISTTITQSGSAQTTNNPFDLRITGNSFFVVNDTVNTYFTRDGSFNVDAAGNLVMASTGYTVMGWGVENSAIKKDTVTSLSIMNAANLTYPPEATTAAYVSGIIDKHSPELEEDYGKIMNLNFYDKLGYSYTAKLSIKATGKDGNYSCELYQLLDSDNNDVTEKYGAKLGNAIPVELAAPTTLSTATGYTLTKVTDGEYKIVHDGGPGAYEVITIKDNEWTGTVYANAGDAATNTNGSDMSAEDAAKEVAAAFGYNDMEAFRQLVCTAEVTDGGETKEQQFNVVNQLASLLDNTTPEADGTYKMSATHQRVTGCILNYSTVDGAFLGINGAASTSAAISFGAGASNFEEITIDFANSSNVNNEKTSTISATSGNTKGQYAGRKIGEMTGVSIQNDGKIYATYDNGQSKLLGQIAVASFANAAGLSKQGDNLYASTQNSGSFDGIGIDITSDGGYMTTGELEMSNVDLSSELTGMIVTQRGFQANSRIITVSDTMLEELVNLKR